MYAAMAVVRFYEQRVENRNEALPYFEYAIQWCLNKGETALNEFIVNFPNTAVRGLMRVLTNTYTTAVKGISDDLKRELSEASMQDTSIKAQLTHLVKVIPGDGNDINEQAFKAKHAVMPQLKKIQKALRKTPVVPYVSFENAVGKLQEAGELTALEVALIIEYNDKRKLAIRVDEFTLDLELLDKDLNLVDEKPSDQANAA
jgi:acyl-CoA dehydrogenase